MVTDEQTYILYSRCRTGVASPSVLKKSVLELTGYYPIPNDMSYSHVQDDHSGCSLGVDLQTRFDLLGFTSC